VLAFRLRFAHNFAGMLDHFSIFNRNGVMLWSEQLSQDVQAGESVNDLVRYVLLEERAVSTYDSGKYQLKWTLANELDLVFVVVFNKLFAKTLGYLDDLLLAVKTVRYADKSVFHVPRSTLSPLLQAFLASEADSIKQMKPVNFSKTFHRIWRAADGRDGSSSLAQAEAASSSGDESPAAGHIDDAPLSPATKAAADVAAMSKEERAALLRAAKGSRRGGGGGGGRGVKAKGGKGGNSKGSDPKKPRRWDDTPLSAEEASALDVGGAGAGLAHVTRAVFSGNGSGGEMEEGWSAGGAAGGGDSGWWASMSGAGSSLLGRLTGGAPLTSADIKPVMDKLRDHLMEKNVARDIAVELCGSVSSSLVGVAPGSMQSVSSTVKDALAEAVKRLLTPRTSIDVLAQANAKNAQKGSAPFTIVFIGVNGVGKSTSLSKVVYYLKDNGKDVMIAACDTFRSGAVEQLKRHATALDVPLFERGYVKDSAAVAQAAVRHATEDGKDVVVIDTAGRMQNNRTLMVELAALVDTVSPDLVLFVGEALVGNDGVDQLTAFHTALQDHSRSKNPRGIDGVVLTKFDTIDDKVGASLSMVYRTGVPIVFVGTGQQYTNLRKLNVASVVDALLS